MTAIDQPQAPVRAGTTRVEDVRDRFNDATRELEPKVERARGAIDFGVGIWDATGGRGETMLSHGTRHAMDSVTGFGLPSNTWNARHAYRTKYTDDQRLAAGVGDVVGAVLPLYLAVVWRRRGFNVVGVGGAKQRVAQVAGGLGLAAASVTGARKVQLNTRDDGDLRAVGVAAAASASFYAARGLTKSRLLGLGGLVGGATGGAYVGTRLQWADPNRAPAAPTAPKLEGTLAPLAFARGFWTHFVEEGPLSPGVGFGKPWDQRTAFRQRYTDPERFGGMSGDIAATVVTGVGALSVTSRIIDRNDNALTRSPLARLSSSMSIPAKMVTMLQDFDKAPKLLDFKIDDLYRDLTVDGPAELKQGRKPQERALEAMLKRARNPRRGVPTALWATGAGLVGYTLYEAYSAGANGKNPVVGGPASAAIAAAFMGAGAAVMTRKVSFLHTLPSKTRGAMSTAAAAAFISGTFMVRGPAESALQDARDVYSKPKFGPTQVGLVTGGVGLGVAGGMRVAHLLALKGASRHAAIGAGALAGAAVGAAFMPAFD